MKQECQRTKAEEGKKCPNAAKVTTPDPTPYAPAPLEDPSLMEKACPFLDGTKPHCCGDDNVQIIAQNFQALDAVFNTDCPVCAVNLKTMWCNYACDPEKHRFLKDLGTTEKDGLSYREVHFTLDPDYACSIFQSCKKISLIAQAGISSSIGFMDFLGVNGQDQSMSIITFDFIKDELKALDGEAYDCGMEVPEDGVLMNYTKITNSSCSYCDEACEPPTINSEIGLLDGFDGKMVGITYAVLIAFTIVFQVLAHCLCKSKERTSGAARQGGEESTRAYTNAGNSYSRGRQSEVNYGHNA